MADVRDGKFHPDREKDELSRALGNKEHKGRSRGVPGSPSWLVGFPESSDTYRSRERAKREQAERIKKLEEIVEKHQMTLDSITSQQQAVDTQLRLQVLPR